MTVQEGDLDFYVMLEIAWGAQGDTPKNTDTDGGCSWHGTKNTGHMV